jgi:hypothetical protein
LKHSDPTTTSPSAIIPDLASGTVTFLFTDIEGNTAQTAHRSDGEHGGTVTRVAEAARADCSGHG